MLPHQLDDHGSLTASAPDARSGLDAAREQVDRILASDTLRASEVLRRLLRFLADKTFAGEADHLKEYSVGLDALGKPPPTTPGRTPASDCRHPVCGKNWMSTIATKAGNDPLTIELPRGRFKIVWHPQRRRQRFRSPLFPLSVVGPVSRRRLRLRWNHTI